MQSASALPVSINAVAQDWSTQMPPDKKHSILNAYMYFFLEQT
jgi:hypothetical protein